MKESLKLRGWFWRCSSLILLIPSLLVADEKLDFSRFQPGIKLNVENLGKRSIAENRGTFSDTNENLSFGVPIYRSIRRSKEEDFSFQQWLINGNFGASQPEISFLNRRHSFYRTNLSFTILSATSGENLYLLSAGSGIEEDDRTLPNYMLNFYFFGAATWRLTPEFMFLVGLDFGSILGRNMFLPFFGFQWEASYRTTFSFAFPTLLQFSTRIGKKTDLSIFAALASHTSRISNDGEFPGEAPQLRYRFTQYKIGTEWTYWATKHLGFSLEGGGAAARHLTIFSDQGDKFSKPVTSGLYISGSFNYRFGESWEEKLETLKKHFSMH